MLPTHLDCLLIIATLGLFTKGGGNAVPSSVVKVGNRIAASKSSTLHDGYLFLINQGIQNSGIVFGFSAYFMNANKVRFQIWRPVANVSEETFKFRLIFEVPYIPSVENDREDVYVVSQLTTKCVRVGADDRLGIYIEEAPGSIPYSFDTQNVRTLYHKLNNKTHTVALQEQLIFDSLTYPFSFSTAVYIDTNLTKYGGQGDYPACPKLLQIPSEGPVGNTPTLAPVVGATGATGATGLEGPLGIIGPIGPMGLPGYAGLHGATGMMGLPGFNGTSAGAIGATGVSGPKGASGPDGSQGTRGKNGATGVSGPVGPPGPPGYKSKPGKEGVNDVGASKSQSMSASTSGMVLGMIIWLIILTIVLIIMIIMLIFLCRIWRREQNLRHQEQQVDELWMNTLRGESTKDYYNEKEVVGREKNIPKFTWDGSPPSSPIKSPNGYANGGMFIH